MTLQKFSLTGDATIRTDSPDIPYGLDIVVSIGYGGIGANARGVFSFDISSIISSNITDAKLYLYGLTGGGNTYLHKLQSPFIENQVTWNNASTGTPWIIPGGNYDTSILSQIAFTANTWNVFNIPVSALSSITYLLVKTDETGGNKSIYYISKEATSTVPIVGADLLHPYVEITYSDIIYPPMTCNLIIT